MLEPQDRISADRTGGTSKPQPACWVPGDISSNAFLPFPSSVSSPCPSLSRREGFLFLGQRLPQGPPTLIQSPSLLFPSGVFFLGPR